MLRTLALNLPNIVQSFSVHTLTNHDKFFSTCYACLVQ